VQPRVENVRPIYASGECRIDLVQRELCIRGLPVPIGGRAFEFLEVLVRSAGKLVTKDELMSRIWPGAVVMEHTLQVHAGAIRRALGPHRGVLKTESRRGYRLVGNWTMQSRDAANPPTGPTEIRVTDELTRNNFPIATAPLIGRSAAAQRLRDLLSAYRVVTLTGPGGIGKTTLALQLGRNLLPEFADGCWFVELASLSEPALVPSAVARVLGLTLVGDANSSARIAGAIGRQHLLLILDNCEHVIGVAAELVEAIVSQCPNTTLLTTSREILRADGEHVYPVPPLDVPPPDQNEPDALVKHSAVELFIAKTQARDSDFSPHRDDFLSIASICRHLDGIPLAIEFAAARAATFRLPEVEAGLDKRFALLTAGRRTALPRHQTLLATLDWSYELLPVAEQLLLRRLAIFAAGFTLEGAVAVAADYGTAESSVAEGIANLFAKSLVTRDGSSTTGRWQLLETIRMYALEKLNESGEAAQIARRHAEFFRDFFAPSVSGLPSHPSIEGLARYIPEIDNVRTALDWAFGPLGDPAVGIVLTAAYAPVWLRLSLVAECRERAERASASLETDSTLDARLRMHVQIVLGMSEVQSTVEGTESNLGQALEVAESLDDAPAQLRALWGVWSCRNYIGEHRAAQPLAERFLAVARRAGDLSDVLVGDRLLGITLHYLGDQAQARHCLQRVLDLYIPPADQRHMIWFQHDQRVVSRAMLARVLCLQGFVEQAKQNLQASVAAAQAANHTLSLRYVLGWAVCPIALTTGDLATAEQSTQMLIELSIRHHLPFLINIGRSLEGTLAIRRGEFASGVALVRATLEAPVGHGRTMYYPDLLGVLAEGLAGLGELAEAIATIDDALARSERTGDLWSFPDLLRIRGELLLRDGGGQGESSPESVAEVCFRRAIDVARSQAALFWELRAAVSLARLKIAQHRPAAAREVLAPVYGRFTEGFQTPDQRAARALLDKLPSHRTGSGR
jgi:predicted ATPase/DNA-binding winged helix-turn-helix (wHTH) protein